jgi:hypothetical protein
MNTSTAAQTHDLFQHEASDVSDSGIHAVRAWAALRELLSDVPKLLEDMRSFHTLQRSAQACEDHQPRVAAELRTSALALFATR